MTRITDNQREILAVQDDVTGVPFYVGGDSTTQSMNVNVAGTVLWDYIGVTTTSTTETYVFKTGGSGGTTLQTIVITYTDSTKTTISNVTKT